MSSTLLDAHRITRRYGARTVLDAVDLRVGADARIGLVGANGAGKSTLLRILAGLEPPDGGSVRRLGSVGYLPQLTAGPGPALTVRQLILERAGVAPAARLLERHSAALADGDLAAIEPHAAALERWLGLGGADADARLSAALGQLGLRDQFAARGVATLSGGQRARVGIAALAVARFDVVLLDEPTNHLDGDGLERLRALLAERPGGVVLATHDRTLLTETVDQVVELVLHSGQATHFGGDWATFEREREAERARLRAEHEQALAQRAQLLAAEQETRRRGAASARRARARVHDNDKNSREWVTMRAEEMAGRARKMGGRARRIEIPDRPWEHRALRLALTPDERRRPWVVALERFVVRRGAWSLGPLDLVIAHGERILISGPNGSGKSTLLAALSGDVGPAAGARRAAPGAVFAHLQQLEELRVADGTLVDRISALTGLAEQAARTALGAFGLGSEIAGRPVNTLSPGEQTRAALTVIAQRRATCLLLDEPTNHLDIESLEVLEAALGDWPGALAVATHDHRLRRELRLDRELAL